MDMPIVHDQRTSTHSCRKTSIEYAYRYYNTTASLHHLKAPDCQ
jgi:hypothetical protein